MPVSPHTLARHCATLRAEPYAPPTVESIERGERLLSSGIRLPEPHVPAEVVRGAFQPGLAAHAVSEIGHPPPSEAPRVPRLRRPTVLCLWGLGLAAALACTAVVWDALRPFFWR